MKKHLFSIALFFLFGITAKSQEITIPKKSEPESLFYEVIFNQNRNFGCDTLSLIKYLRPLAISKDQKQNTLYNLMLAKGLANCFDKYNPKSNGLFEHAIHHSKKLGIEMEILANISYGKYLYEYRQMTVALPYFLRTEHLLEIHSNTELINPQDTYKWIGYYFGTIGDKESSIQALEKAKSLSTNQKKDYAAIVDALGLYYLEQEKIQKAESYFRDAIQVSKSINDEMRYAKALGNLGLVMNKKGLQDSAKAYLKKDIEISERFKEDQNTMFANTKLAEIYLQTGDLENTEKHLDVATRIYQSKSYFATNGLEIEKLKAELYRKQNKPQKELESFQKITALENIVKITDGDIALKNTNLLKQKAKLQQINNEAQYQKERSELMRNIYLGLIFFALILAGFIFTNSKKVIKNRELRYKQKVLGLELDQVKAEQKLSDTKENLDAQIEFLKHKNIQIQQLKTEIEKINKSRSSYLEKQQGHLSTLLESHLMTDENWNNFKREFTKAYPDFYSKLQNEFPNLTEANYRVVLLQKLNFNNNEISELLGITIDAVKKSKQRLKKKLGDRYTELSEIITEKQ